MTKPDTGNPSQDLANAIVIQAANDWRKANAIVARASPQQIENAMAPKARASKLKKAIRTKQECEEFFLGTWIKTLTDVDGEMILSRLKRE